jgi:serine/threonine protein phosphatase 1
MLRMDSSGYRHWAKAPPDTRLYAIGDIHGRLDLLDQMQEMIRSDARSSSATRFVVVYLGDYIDRGPASRGVIDRLLDDPLNDFERVHILGNHEEIMLQFLDHGLRAEPWFTHGARETYMSYGLEAPQPSDSLAFPAARAALRERLPAHHRAFLEGLTLSHREGDYLFVHGGIRPGVALDAQDPHDLVWIRYEFLESDVDFGVCVVHGHTPEPEPTVKRNRIGLDTGAWRTGVLTCAVIEGDSVRILQT